MASTSFDLNDGTSIPWLAWGNATGTTKERAIDDGKLALDAGIRHIDTAQNYHTEVLTGETIRESDLDKSAVYVTSKLSCISNEGWIPVPLADVRASIQGSLDRLGFVPDLYLIHNPFVAPRGEGDLKKLWKIFEELKDEGKLKSIGVSNFRPQDFEAILDGAKYKPVVNQIEFHPYTLAHLEPVLELQAKHGILTQSYGGLTPILRHPTGGPLKPILERIAARLTGKYGVDIDQAAVLLLWLKAQRAGVVTASGNPERIRKLAKIYQSEWELDPEEVEEISRVGKTIHYRHYRNHMEKDFPVPDLPQQ